MIHKESHFTGKSNLNIYFQSWAPDTEAKAVLLVVHGMAEHSGRYAQLAEYFTAKGFTVYALDHRGHGKSEGARCYVDRFSDYIDDLKSFCDIVRSSHVNLKIFLVGHSMGGTIAAAYAVKYQDTIAGLVLSGALLKPGATVTPLQIRLARILSALVPKMGIAVLTADAICRDKAVVDAYVNDPLVYRGKICARLGSESMTVIHDYLPKAVSNITLPVLVMYGTADTLCNPEGSDRFYETVGSKDKAVKRYEGFFHEIFNETGHEQVFADMAKWLNARL